ncbi:hypothetical protein EBN03_33265 [Nocardia stercoris]|uniref:Uncharacterized protein n=1 Tax=Nocardia stercoris TaxID=2483361 RepID=A0A3M2KSM2_9NOCA|nr:hypothetical protein EBN03_33265 [Nocardia stercoris]
MAYQLTLPHTRHERLGDFRVLVLDEPQLIPVGSAVRGSEPGSRRTCLRGARVQHHRVCGRERDQV